jgi:hypothetical protein
VGENASLAVRFGVPKALSICTEYTDFATLIPGGFDGANGAAGMRRATGAAGTQRLTRSRGTIRENGKEILSRDTQ